MNYQELDCAALKKERQALKARLEECTKNGISLDLSRGKPAKEQLELSLKMLDVLDHRSILDSENGQDCRNYGGLDGIPEAKRLLAHMMGTHSSNTIVGGNSSLTLMYQIVSHGMTEGICGGTPWSQIKSRKFLCPVPGYDRHFAITEHFGFELIPIKMLESGPDMDEIERYITDETVKGIWCVPKYQNPTGTVFSPETVRRFAALKPAAKDFRIFWDNAYCIHAFDGPTAEIPDIISECEKAGNPNLVYEFCSTSKITFPGSGISAVAASPANLIDIKSFLQLSTIGPDKLNQLQHARFFKNSAGLRAHMKKHAAIFRRPPQNDIHGRRQAGRGHSLRGQPDSDGQRTGPAYAGRGEGDRRRYREDGLQPPDGGQDAQLRRGGGFGARRDARGPARRMFVRRVRR